ncbi:MAG: hypothetical protein AAFO02_22140 [Bacteroidota bacterium]
MPVSSLALSPSQCLCVWHGSNEGIRTEVIIPDSRFFFGYGPFTITIKLINPIVLAEHLLEDLYKIGKAIWDASFKIYLAFKNFVTGVVKAVQDVINFLFG